MPGFASLGIAFTPCHGAELAGLAGEISSALRIGRGQLRDRGIGRREVVGVRCP